MDIIFIRGLTVTTIIGIYSWERFFFQKLIFDFDIGYSKNKNKVEVYRSISDYLDYQKISSFVSTIVKNKYFFLLESVAEYVAEELILNFNISWIRLKVSKPGAIAEGVHVGVIIERKKTYKL